MLVPFFQCYAGTQNVSTIQKEEAWKVNVRINDCDLEQGYLCGTMEAVNVPLADTPVSNYFLFHFDSDLYVPNCSFVY